MPWDGGKKFFSDKIYILEKKGDKYNWQPRTFSLPSPVAYGYSITTPKGVLCIGGRNSEKKILSNVFYIKWDPSSENIIIEELPSLPVPLAHLSASIIGEKVYVAGGENLNKSTNYFFSLNISNDYSLEQKWVTLPSTPGLSRAFSVLQSQSNGKEHGLYLFSGRSYDESGFVKILSDSYFFSPNKNDWESLDEKINFPVMAGNSFESGLEFVFLPSGDSGKEYMKIRSLEDLINQFNGLEKTTLLDSLKTSLRDRLINHKGFSKDILVYNTITKTKLKIGELPYGVVTAPVVNWNGDFFIVSGKSAQVFELLQF